MNAKHTPTLSYKGHYFEHSEGHLFLDVPTIEPCTITLTGAAAMSQTQLNKYGKDIVRAVNAHDALVEALELILNAPPCQCDEQVTLDKEVCDSCSYWQQARAALAAAKE